MSSPLFSGRKGTFSSAPSPLFQTTSGLTAAPTPSSAPTVRVREGSQLADPNIDWSRVYRLRERVTAKMGDSRVMADDVPNEDRRQYSRSIIPAEVQAFSDEAARSGNRGDIIDAHLRDIYAKAVEEAIFGYGRWTPLLEDRDVENIEFRGCEHSYMVYGDRIEEAPRVADSDQELIQQTQHLAMYNSKVKKTFAPATPEITLNLEDRFRLHAIGFDIIDRPSIVIRQHKHTQVTLPELVALNMMPAHVADFLAACMVAGRSLVVSGGMGAGKTTMLRALASALPPLRSIGVIETDPELFLQKLPGRHRVINLVAREGSPEAIGPNGRPAGEFSLNRLMVASKRQTLDMVCAGEILGPEAATLFEALQSGAGSFSTIHSQHAEATIERIVSSAAQSGTLTTDDAYRQVGTLLNLIVHIRTDDTRHLPGGRLTRYVEQIIEIQGFSEDGRGLSTRPATETVYSCTDPDAPLKVSPQLADRLHVAGWRSAA